MKVWQGCWESNSGTLYIWGERTAAGGPPEAAPSCDTAHPGHPYALSCEELQADAKQIELDGFTVTSLVLTLPSLGGAPLPSQKAAQGAESLLDTGHAPLTLQQWSVPALAFDTLSALHVLSSLPEQLEALSALPKGVRVDHSLLFLVELTKFALELLSRGRVLPTVMREGELFFARWRPALGEVTDGEKLALLVAGMPLSCGALSDDEPNGVAYSFLHRSIDALCRYFLRRLDLTATLSGNGLRPREEASFRWLAALSSVRGEVTTSLTELSRLEERLKAWAGPLITQGNKIPLRLNFQLEEPKGGQPWTVHFVLQSQFDPHHLLPVELFWRGELGFLKRSESSPLEIEEFLLAALGRASVLWPTLRQSLRSLQPERATLTLDEAFSFLKRNVAQLEEAGFGVTLPRWWKSSSAKLGLELHVSGESAPTSHAPRTFGLNRLLDFSWKVSLGGRTLTEEEFHRLIEEQTPLVQIGEHWVELPQKKMLATLRFLERQKEKEKIRFGDALRLQFEAEAAEGEDKLLPVVAFKTSGWVQRLFESETQMPEVIPQPEEFQGSLRRYQLEGLSWFSFLTSLGLGGCLADDMGLGKTIQFLALLLSERKEAREQDFPVYPTLLVVPMSIIGNWEREAQRFSPTLKVYVHHGLHRLTGSAFYEQATSSDLVITTYSLAYRDEKELSEVCWGRLALDEAQNIKNLTTKQTKSVRRISQRQTLLEHGGCHRIALTGTPLENHLEELWSILDFLNPGALGTLKDFRTRFAVPIERFRNKEAAEQLSQVVRPFILRRVKSDPKIISDLPTKMEMDELISLTPEQAALYQKVLDEMLPQVDQQVGMHRKGMVLATITKLKQVCNHPALALKTPAAQHRSAKLERLRELLEVILDEGDKTLIFTQFVQMGELLKSFVQERFDKEALFLHGALSRQTRDNLVTRFQEPGGPPVFILSLKAGGYGLNLTAANQVIHFDQWWNPATEEQATDRAYRIGQKKNVQVRRFLCKGTLEEKISELVREKRALAKEIVGSSANLLTELSTEELRKVLTLSKDELLSSDDDE